MKQSLMYLIIFLVSFLFVSPLFARPSPPQNPQIRWVKQLPLLTANQVKTLLEEQTETVGQNKIITLDEVYTDHEDNLLITLLAVDDYLEQKKDNVFHGNDYAFFMNASTTYILLKENSAGAVMLGIAILNDRRAVNILITKGKVCIYDIEEHGFRTPKEYIDAGFEFIFIVI